MFAARAKVQALKCNVVAVVLADAKSELHNDELANQGKVHAGHSFEAYRLAKRLVEQHSG